MRVVGRWWLGVALLVAGYRPATAAPCEPGPDCVAPAPPALDLAATVVGDIWEKPMRPHYEGGGFYALALARAGLGYRSSHGLGLAVGGFGGGYNGEELIAVGVGLVDMRPTSEGGDGRLANLIGPELRSRIGSDVHRRVAIGGEFSFQFLDGRWRARAGDLHHALSSDLGGGPYVALALGAGLHLVADAAIRWGFVFDHTRLFDGYSLPGGRWGGTATLEVGIGLLGMYGH